MKEKKVKDNKENKDDDKIIYKRKPIPLEKFQTANFLENVFFTMLLSYKILAQEFARIILQTKDLIVESVETEKVIKPYNKKIIRLDCYIKTKKAIINIEMQNNFEDDLDDRAIFYYSSIITDCLDNKDPYSSLLDVYVIFINNFDCKKHNEDKEHYQAIDKTINKQLSNRFNIIFINGKGKDENNAIIKLLRFLENIGQGDNELFPEITKFCSDVRNTKKGGEHMIGYFDNMIYEAENKAREEGIEVGRVEGRQEGIEQGKINILSDLVNRNVMTVKEVCERYNIDEEKLKNK